MFRKEKGQVLVLFAAGIIVLMAVVALAIDGGNVFSDRRQAQNAADSAAMAAAIRAGDDLTNGNAVNSSAMNNAALNRAADNGYDNASDAADVTIFYPPESAPYSGNANYVEVEIISRVPTFFASVIGFDTLTNRVRSIAHFVPGESGRTYEGAAIVALRPAGGCPKGGIFMQGSGSGNKQLPSVIIQEGGLFSNNADGCAFQSNQCDKITLINSGISIVGSANVDKDCSLTFSKVAQRQFPPEYKPPAHECTGTGVYDSTAKTLSPGTYTEFPPKDVPNQASDVTTLLPGTYCITKSMDINLQGKLTDAGKGVYLYLDTGVDGFTFNGGAGLELSPTCLKTDSSGKCISYTPLIYVDPGQAPYSGKPEACVINGNSTMILTGQIYAPYCDITLNGTSSTNSGQLGSQVIGYTVMLTGTGYVNIIYNDFYAGDISEDPFVEQVR